MAKIISASINVVKITKALLIPGKDGAKYCNIDIILNDEKDQFGNDVSISESQSKEDRLAKVPKNYLGNGKVIWSKESESKPKHEEKQSEPDDDLPF